jgi:uncharacterized tellurite resistance protein B-like protein
MSILDWLGFRGTAPAGSTDAETETVRKIARELDQLPPERARLLAAFAYLLSRVARADLSVSEAETREMERIVEIDGGLPGPQAVLVVQMARTQNLLFGGTENYLVSKEFARMASREHKLGLLRCLFDVGAADSTISAVESTVIRQIADEIGLSHRDFVAVRSGYRERLAVLRKPDPQTGPG